MQQNISHTEIVYFINDYSKNSHVYGQADNFLFVVGLISRICQKDLLAEFVGKYNDVEGLYDILLAKMVNIPEQIKNKEQKLHIWQLIFYYLQSLNFENHHNLYQSKTGDIVWMYPYCEKDCVLKWRLSCSQQCADGNLIQEQTIKPTEDKQAEDSIFAWIKNVAESDIGCSIPNYQYYSCQKKDPLLCLAIMCDGDCVLFTQQGIMYLQYPWPKYCIWSMCSCAQTSVATMPTISTLESIDITETIETATTKAATETTEGSI